MNSDKNTDRNMDDEKAMGKIIGRVEISEILARCRLPDAYIFNRLIQIDMPKLRDRH